MWARPRPNELGKPHWRLELTGDPAPSCSNHPQPETTEIASSGQRPPCRPEDYQVEGPPRVSSGQSPAKQNKRSDKEINRKLVKENWNLGHAYVSEKSRKQMPARRILKERML